MYKYVCIGFFLVLFGCQKEDIVEYDLKKDCIQFDYTSAQMSLSYNFAEQYISVYNDWGMLENYYLGDSLRRDTISLNLSLIGWEGNADREFRLRTVPLVELDTLPMATVEFQPTYTFRADQLKDTIQVVLIRPEARGRYGVGITFDVESKDAIFDIGVEEKSIYELYISDTYAQPDNWSVDYLGEFSEEKYAFMVSVLHMLYSPNTDWSQYNQFLRDELAKYNDEHPETPKDFEFPVNTIPAWYESASVYLGEYSDAKRDFIITYLGSGVWSEWTYWPSVMPFIKSIYNAYNQSHPDNPLPFTFPE